MSAWFRCFVAVLLLGGMLMSASHAAGSLDAYRWKDRLLIVFADDAASAALGKQRAIAASLGGGMQERDLLLIEVVGDTVHGASGSESAANLRQRFGVRPDAFRVLLVGKDGGVKLDSTEPVAATQLTGTIDAMPMRQQEAGTRAVKRGVGNN
jgi:Domain of unknown function (DUF4174)